ncbi:MAG: pullulanase-type alpha-1,6-glucosidase [Chloroflexota bacterium]
MTRRWLFVFPLLLLAASAHAAHTDPPETVHLTGTFLDEIGCAEDWMADCEAAAMNFDETHQLWLAEIEVPAGEYEYKITLNGTFDDTVGATGAPDWPNIPLVLAADTTITFLYNDNTHYLADSVNRIIANVPGNFNAEIGCPDTGLDDGGNPGDWAPDCWQTLLEDIDGDGIYTYITTKIPPGDYESKVAVGGNWGENYGDNGAPGGANIGFSVTKPDSPVTFEWDSETKIMKITAEGAPKGNLKELAAYWVSPDTILTSEDSANRFELFYSADGGLEVDKNGLSGGESWPLEVMDDFDAAIKQKFPHLTQLTALKVPAEAQERIDELLRGQVALNVTNPGNQPVTATGLQIPGVLDALYTYDGPLGVEFGAEENTYRVWAPTAKNVTMRVPDPIEMVRDDTTGVWSVTIRATPKVIYQYEVEVFVPSEGEVLKNLVTDPYSTALMMNSEQSIATNLQDAELKPEGWETLAKPELNAFEDVILYELHVRDFSIIDESVPEEQRGTFMAFTHKDSNGMQHLARLSAAGLTHVHLLPVFDIATINEDKEAQRAPIDRFLTNFEPDSDQQQQAIFNLRDEDGFNWGYDPFHYTVPEGSYATEPNGTQRTLEFRQMVQSLNETGLRVVMDVVYNHTNAAGQSDKSVLDQIVPGYYHRLNSKGKVENSTCCANTATEHNMMRKLMVDSVVTWAVDYKVDGFRFDLMGHHMKEDMLAVRAALDALTIEEHGVNGKAIVLYGEGWNFGEVASGARGINATQIAMEGTGIGTFNDRIRDAARGGNPFGGEQEQGFATGLLTNPNEVSNESDVIMANRLTLFGDQIRVGLTGNLADYEFTNRDGDVKAGKNIDYNGSATGYTADPQEVINYVSAHDNETLFDAIQLKLPVDANMATRVQHQNFALSITMLGQGIPFFHAGSEILRSKSMDRDSYNSGDWFNAIDWTYNENNWGRGLPVADKNEGKWDLMRPLLADGSLKPDQQAILANLAGFETLLQIRNSSPLFRLRTAEQVNERVAFHNTGEDQLPGLIVMSIDDSGDERIDPNYDKIVVLFNGRADEVTFEVPDLAGLDLKLHHQQSTLAASFADGVFTVPGVTTAVFVLAGDATVELEKEFGETAMAPAPPAADEPVEPIEMAEEEPTAEPEPTPDATATQIEQELQEPFEDDTEPVEPVVVEEPMATATAKAEANQGAAADEPFSSPNAPFFIAIGAAILAAVLAFFGFMRGRKE